jgi:hypothetical protein
MSNKIQVHKLVSGEEVIGESGFSSTTGKTTIKNPVGISIVRGKNGEPSIGFVPFPSYAPQTKDSTFSIEPAKIAYSYEPAEDFVTNYNAIFGAGLIVPPKKDLILG